MLAKSISRSCFPDMSDIYTCNMLRGVSIACLALSVFGVILRLVVRTVHVKRLYLDDWLMLLAVVSKEHIKHYNS